MAYLYSPTAQGFFLAELGSAPTDAIAITDAQHATLLAGVNSGQAISIVAGVPTLTTPEPVAPTLAALQARVLQAATSAASRIVTAVYPSPSAQSALENAANIVANSGGAPASGSPFYAAFNALAATFGLTPAAFATLVTVAMTESLTLHSAEVTLAAAVAAATTAAELASALAAYQTAVGRVVAAINAAGLPTPLAAPASITIPGVNA